LVPQPSRRFHDWWRRVLPRIQVSRWRDPRLLVIVLRGALDGLGMVAPVGDPDWVGLRGDKALVLDGKTPALPLDSFFALNPAMPNLHRLYQARQATIVHAVASPYRDRSHFDGQDVLESGYATPGFKDSGWLNRALTALEPDGRVNPRGSRERAFALGPVTPLVARGSAPMMTWVPQQLLPAGGDTQMRVLDLYRHTDPKLAHALEGRRDLVALGPAPGAMRQVTLDFDALAPAQGLVEIGVQFVVRNVPHGPAGGGCRVLRSGAAGHGRGSFRPPRPRVPSVRQFRCNSFRHPRAAGPRDPARRG